MKELLYIFLFALPLLFSCGGLSDDPLNEDKEMSQLKTGKGKNGGKKSDIENVKKIKYTDFEFHTRTDGLNNLYNTKQKSYHFSNWYNLKYRTGLSPAIIFKVNDREVSFSTFEIEKYNDDYLKNPYPKIFNSCDDLIKFARYKSLSQLNDEWEETGVISEPWDSHGMADNQLEWLCNVTWPNIRLIGKPVKIGYKCRVNISSYSGIIEVVESSLSFNGISCDDYE